MKKNNKFRNNSGNSNAYSLNYKFDSISPAGKINGTALDLIKKYNELAKEAHGCGDYIEMEVYRQYAEHYRKIVTEINERRAVRAENMAQQTEENSAAEAESATEAAAPQAEEAPAEATAEPATAVEPAPRKSFKVIEIQPQSNSELTEENMSEAPAMRPRRIIRRVKKPAAEAVAAAAI